MSSALEKIEHFIEQHGLKPALRRDISLLGSSAIMHAYTDGLQEFAGFNYGAVGAYSHVVSGTSYCSMINQSLVAERTESFVKKHQISLDGYFDRAEKMYRQCEDEFTRLRALEATIDGKTVISLAKVYERLLVALGFFNCFYRYTTEHRGRGILREELVERIGKGRNELGSLYPKIETEMRRCATAYKGEISGDLLLYMTIDELESFVEGKGEGSHVTREELVERSRGYFHTKEFGTSERVVSDPDAIEAIRSKYFSLTHFRSTARKNELPVYKKIFTRDFMLATVEIWVRPETINPKIWTSEKQPFFPYIICERKEGRVNAFYDPRGIAWMKRLLIGQIKRDDGFLTYISTEYKRVYLALKETFDKQHDLSQKELSDFLSAAEAAWTWFEALWWVWELTPEEQKGVSISHEIFTLRENTQEIVPEIERVTRNTLSRLYPDLGCLIEVLTVTEISSETIPPKAVLEERYRGYFFVENKLIVRKDRIFIEETYQMTFERPLIDSMDIVRGQCGFKGLVRGKVKILYGPKQIGKVEEGDIIISPMTMPDVLPAMKKAAAFVTDEGGIMCHAAIIAREMKKPCIIGTRYATEVFKDGDEVEVDAEKGIVTLIKRT